MDLQELFRSLVNQAGTKSVYSDPISSEGRTVVPVAKVRCGFGGGSGRKPGDKGEGGGGGGGFVAKPVGYIEVSAHGTRFIPIVDPWDLALAAGVGIFLGMLVGKMLSRKPGPVSA
jgi:uncharacterized spore protein YtfJ